MRRQVALVTGGASGIGRSLAAALATRGHDVVIADVDEVAAGRPRSRWQPTLRRPVAASAAVPLDVTDRAAFAAVAQQVAADHGSLDLLFNNAGIGVGGLVDELGDEHWDRCLAVNLHGVVHGVQAAVPIMTEQGSGHIVNTASMAGLMTVPMMLPYTTTKHAVVALSRALRAELKPVGVGVTAVCPAFIATPLLDNLNPGHGRERRHPRRAADVHPAAAARAAESGRAGGRRAARGGEGQGAGRVPALPVGSRCSATLGARPGGAGHRPRGARLPRSPRRSPRP